jgi:hypothetical protein
LINPRGELAFSASAAMTQRPIGQCVAPLAKPEACPHDQALSLMASAIHLGLRDLIGRTGFEPIFFAARQGIDRVGASLGKRSKLVRIAHDQI